MNVEADFMVEQLLKRKAGDISRKLPFFLMHQLSKRRVRSARPLESEKPATYGIIDFSRFSGIVGLERSWIALMCSL